ncbi:MAG: alpha/beta fold hydrolase [Bryobacterales bacterium]|nr:alpha/beta fold hydrolase [Bryobacterales bacterium]
MSAVHWLLAAALPLLAGDTPEREVTVGSGEWVLPATLTLPSKGKAPFPAAILVHGSGPQDRDETIGANKPFRDLAHGLASRGIAVLRYDKRTLHYRDKLAAATELTPKEEVLDDAAQAVQLLTRTAEIDPKRIFVAGHGMGATLAPRIARTVAAVAGIAMLAPSARSVADVLAEQIAYLRTQPENQAPEAQGKIADIERSIEKLRNIAPDDSGFVLGAPIAYWRWWSKYDPVGEARAVEQPIFIAQGKRDFQVTMTDFEMWRQGLGSRPNVTMKSYPELNHLFQPGKGRSKPEEYMKPGKMAASVLDDLAAWIKGR